MPLSRRAHQATSASWMLPDFNDDIASQDGPKPRRRVQSYMNVRHTSKDHSLPHQQADSPDHAQFPDLDVKLDESPGTTGRREASSTSLHTTIVRRRENSPEDWDKRDDDGLNSSRRTTIYLGHPKSIPVP